MTACLCGHAYWGLATSWVATVIVIGVCFVAYRKTGGQWPDKDGES